MEAAAESGLFVLADVHQDMFTDRFQGNGMPDWMAIDDGQMNAPLVGFPGNYFFGNAALRRSFDNWWANVDGPEGDPLQAHYAEGLRRLAAAMADNERLLGYDVFNEPWPGTPWPGCNVPEGCAGPGEFDATLLSDFTDRAVAGIRAADPTHLAFYEPNLIFDYGAPTGHRDPADARTALSFHNYCQSEGAGGDTGTCGAEEQKVFDNAIAHAGATGSAPLMTEFGATDSTATMERLAAAADRNMVGWQYWTYSNVFAGNDFISTSLIEDMDLPPTPDNIKQPAMDVLARPYPQVVAGTPTGWKWDAGKKEFTLSYSTTGPADGSLSGTGETEVFVPGRHFPGGYFVGSKGARVVSDPGARLLRLRNCPGAKAVSLTVGPVQSLAKFGDPCGTRCPPAPKLTKKLRRTRRGTAEGERMVGSRAAERLFGRGGDDCLNGKGGPDLLNGGQGDDVLKGGPGTDRLKCGKGRDVAYASRADRVAASCEKVRGKRR